MSLLITVRGTAEETYPAERATLSVTVSIAGDDKADVARRAGEVQGPLHEQLEQLEQLGAVTRWSAGQVQVYSHRPWGPDGTRLPVEHVARLDATADFVDFARLSGFIDHWSGQEGVEISGPAWDVTPQNRRAYEAEVRRAAVDDAIHKAQAYSTAVRRGRVVAVELADPGMLGDQREGGVSPMFARMSADAAGGAAIAVTPEPIVIASAVDARFTTETP